MAVNEKDYITPSLVSLESATAEEIRKLQTKARKLHPMYKFDAEERFKEVSALCRSVKDAEKRRRYDAMRSGSFYGGGYGPSVIQVICLWRFSFEGGFPF